MKKDKEKIRAMFDSIAHKYDFLNHFLSVGIDKRWRNKVANVISKNGAASIIDVATGTGDLAIVMAKKISYSNIVAVDMSPKMLEVATQKIEKLNLQGRISTSIEDALCLGFKDDSFDALTISFGVRNFENLEKGLSELLRVVKIDGMVVILEISKPQGILSAPFMFYFKSVLPMIGKMVSSDEFAYSYLPDSVVEFPSGADFVSIMTRLGYKNVTATPLTQGIATMYSATK